MGIPLINCMGGIPGQDLNIPFQGSEGEYFVRRVAPRSRLRDWHTPDSSGGCGNAENPLLFIDQSESSDRTASNTGKPALTTEKTQKTTKSAKFYEKRPKTPPRSLIPAKAGVRHNIPPLWGGFGHIPKTHYNSRRESRSNKRSEPLRRLISTGYNINSTERSSIILKRMSSLLRPCCYLTKEQNRRNT